MAAVVSKDECVGCSVCVSACPVSAIEMIGDKAVIEADTCIDCGVCVDECPTKAISI